VLVDNVGLKIRLELALEVFFKVEDNFEVDVAHFEVLVVFFSASSALAQASKPQNSN